MIITLSASLLFLPLTASTDNNTLAQSKSDPPEVRSYKAKVAGLLKQYETEQELYDKCVHSVNFHNSRAIRIGARTLDVVSTCGGPPEPPQLPEPPQSPAGVLDDTIIIDTTANSNASAQSQSQPRDPYGDAIYAYQKCLEVANTRPPPEVLALMPDYVPLDPSECVRPLPPQPPAGVIPSNEITIPTTPNNQTELFGTETTGAMQTIAPEVSIAIGGTIAAGCAGGVVLLYKQGYLKGTKKIVKKPEEKVAKHQETNPDNNLSIIELRIECGLENSEVINRESGGGYNMITGELTEVEQKFSRAITKILENRKKIKKIEKDIDFIKWCEEAKEDPNKILSKISEEVIGKFLTSVQPYFQNLMLSQIGVETDISVTEDIPKRIKNNITFSIKNPIQAYIELVVYNNRVRVSSTKFIFAINSYLKIKNLTVYFEKVNRHQAQLKQQSEKQIQYRDEEIGNYEDASIGRRRIEIEGLLFGISIEFSKIKIGHIEKTIEPPLGLGKKEVEIKKNILFSSPNK